MGCIIMLPSQKKPIFHHLLNFRLSFCKYKKTRIEKTLALCIVFYEDYSAYFDTIGLTGVLDSIAEITSAKTGPTDNTFISGYNGAFSS